MEEDILLKLYEELLKVRTYLIKIGPSRRTGNILEKKFSEATSIIQQYNSCIDSINKSINIKEENLLLKYCEHFDKLYSEIIKLCQEQHIIRKMGKFDLKIALNLLPVMTNDVSNTRQLIDGIEYYSSVIDADSQKELIIFVLKSRLSQHAKLKVSKNYETIDTLISDMKRMLLPQKSASALQKQLLTSRQNDLSIDDYGKKLSEMFVELTITQAGGDAVKYDVLKSVNENQAIKQFCEGLRNRRVGTIIAAQKFNDLKDAIQAAIDEDCSSSNSTGEMFLMRRGTINNNTFNNNSRQRTFYNPQRGYGRGAYYSPRPRGYAGHWSQPRADNRQQFQQWQQPTAQEVPRGRGNYRGNFSNNITNNAPFRGQIHLLTGESPPPGNESIPAQSGTFQQSKECENEFFRD